MTAKFKLYVLVVLGLYACKLTKDINITEPPVAAAFRDVQTTDTTSIADIKWKDFFTDPTLQSLIDSALLKNYDMQVAVKNIEAAQLAYSQVKWNYVPSAAFNITAASTRPSDNSLNGLTSGQLLQKNHIEDFSANVALSWEADIWGKIRNQQKSALAKYLQTNEAKKAIQTNIISQVSQGFYNLLMLDAQLAIAKKNLALTDSTLFITKLQFNSGQVTSLAVQQVTAQEQAAAQLVPQFEKDRLLQENALSILTGTIPAAINSNTSLDQVIVPANLKAGVPSAMVKRRPDIRSRELDLTIANANVGITQASMYPSLTITAAGGLNSFKASNWFNIPASLFGAVAGGISQPLLQHKQLKTQFEIAKVEREKTVIQFRQSVLLAIGEVSDALAKLDKLKLQKDIAANRVNTLQQATSNAGLLFQNGMANYIEVITAQSNVLQSEIELAVLKRAELGAAVELYRSLGGGQ
jgi:NodT family efflux transporter outer membrane factor (OMF) lipoprotein